MQYVLMHWVYKIWRENIRISIKRLCDYNGINWLRTWVYYNKFLNLGELIKRYLLIKLWKDLELKYFVDRKCNCNSTTKVNGICALKGERIKWFVVYKITCKYCGNFYVDNTQKKQKNWNRTSKMWPKRSCKIIIWTLFLITSLNILHKNRAHNNAASLCLLK